MKVLGICFMLLLMDGTSCVSYQNGSLPSKAKIWSANVDRIAKQGSNITFVAVGTACATQKGFDWFTRHERKV